MKIAVIDDERPARSELKHQLLELLPDAEIQEGDCGAAALQLAGNETFDLFFLDINLGDIHGTVLVNALKKMQPDAKIVFVTAYSDYAVEAFELEVDDYILKPYNTIRLQKVLHKCLGEHSENNTGNPGEATVFSKRIAISHDGKLIFEDTENIVFIETYNRGCKIYTPEQIYFENKSIGEYEKKLNPAHFFRVHKSFLIHLDQVREIFPWGQNSFCLRMRGYENNIIPIARDKTKTLKHLLT